MTTKLLKLSAAVLWAATAIGTAAQADAYIYTYQDGDYASCSASYYAQENKFCWSSELQDFAFNMHYVQGIKLVSNRCWSGACNNDSSTVYTESIYSTGRKIVANIGACDNHFFALGSCHC